MNNIRNFCILAHVDHGKSTLADRMLELTHTVEQRKMREQLLDQMDLERERGITIKLQPVRMQWRGYTLNLIDTPGHTDFAYEVSRSIAAVDGAVLLVDASQGVQAQTIANLHMAQKYGLKIIPVVNKIDLSGARPEETALQMKQLLKCSDDDILFASGKTGEGVSQILNAVIDKIPMPAGDEDAAPRALIFDSVFDPYRGVITYVRVIDGKLKKGDKLYFLATQKESLALEVGGFYPDLKPEDNLATGQIGYIVTDVKTVRDAKVGDTISTNSRSAALPGYTEPQPMVYAGLYPMVGEERNKLRDALDKLKLSDASLTFEPEQSQALGFGFRAGFLGMLHMDIVRERLLREWGVEVIFTTPSVPIKIKLRDGTEKIIHQASEFPDLDMLLTSEEPYVNLEIVTPENSLGPIMDNMRERRAVLLGMEQFGEGVKILKYHAPLLKVVIDLADTIKSLSQGYASLSYELADFVPSSLVRLDILLAAEKIDSLAQVIHESEAVSLGRDLAAKLKEIIPRQMFEVAIQAAQGGKILARENLPAMRKDVTAKLYGGDVTRKNKLLEKQKAGKRKMKALGRVSVPGDVFMKLLAK